MAESSPLARLPARVRSPAAAVSAAAPAPPEQAKRTATQACAPGQPEASAPLEGAQPAGVAARSTAGRSFPLGATVGRDGVNFSVFSKHSSGVELLLFDAPDDVAPSRVITLDPHQHRTYHYWHAFVPDIGPGQIYGYRVAGAYAPDRGLRFDRDKVLLDPYGTCVAWPARRSRAAAMRPGDNTASALKSVVADPSRYDWEDDRPPCRPFATTVLYEMHVGAFTRHPNSGVEAARRGTFAGVVEKIPYLVDLGVSAVELLPVFAFDDQDAPPGLRNVWGYSPVSFFAPHGAYSSRHGALGALDEFRDMVKAFHRAGIEVILDVVFNHTAEGGADGPTLCFRGLANDTYYLLEDGGRRYADYSGCGNTLNANESIVRRLILDSLRHWVSEMHVDGFRFDLASILSRDEQGRPMASPPVLWDIESDPVLANVKLIAEAWDAAGLCQVGRFVGDRWKEWNGRFRDDVRAFVKGDMGAVRALAYRLCGSPDVYAGREREPEQSVNFVTCHDGFTANDLVSYNHKHNEANGEGNRDGSSTNVSWNCGVEGPTADPDIERLRTRQVKNLIALTLMAVGTPMLLMGDEMRRTQRGNNNPYCHDDETTWFDWSRLAAYAEIHRFTRRCIALRHHRALPNNWSDMTLNELLCERPISWHGVRLNSPDWRDDSHSVAVTAQIPDGRLLHAMFNAYWNPLEFDIPPIPAQAARWRRLVDTGRESPDDIHDPAAAPAVGGSTYCVQARSLALLITSGVARASATP
jgi:isoamylase